MSERELNSNAEIPPDERDDLARRREVENEHRAFTINNDGEITRHLVIEKDPYPAAYVEWDCTNSMKALRARKNNPGIAVTPLGGGLVSIDKSGYGNLFRRLGDFIAMRIPGFAYDPHIEAFWDVCRAYSIIENDTFGSAYIEFAETIIHEDDVKNRKQFLIDLKKDLDSKIFKKKLAARVKAEKRIGAAFMGMWRASFRKRSRNLIVRVDFEYGLKGNPLGFHPLNSPDFPDRFLVDVFVEDRDRFVNNLRDHIRPGGFAEHLKTWGWKVECGVTRGWHLHAVFFFDGRRAKSAWYLAMMLGELWVRLTQGRGTYENVHQKARNYQQVFIGDIHRGDADAESAYIKFVNYISKDDQWPVIKTGTKMKIFGIHRGKRDGR